MGAGSFWAKEQPEVLPDSKAGSQHPELCSSEDVKGITESDFLPGSCQTIQKAVSRFEYKKVVDKVK